VHGCEARSLSCEASSPCHANTSVICLVIARSYVKQERGSCQAGAGGSNGSGPASAALYAAHDRQLLAHTETNWRTPRAHTHTQAHFFGDPFVSVDMLATYRMYVNDGEKAIELASKVTSSQRVTDPQLYDLLLHPAETAGRLVAAISEIAPTL